MERIMTPFRPEKSANKKSKNKKSKNKTIANQKTVQKTIAFVLLGSSLSLAGTATPARASSTNLHPSYSALSVFDSIAQALPTVPESTIPESAILENTIPESAHSPLNGTGAYTPPQDVRTPRGPFTAGGRRGDCEGLSGHGLTALAPQEHIGRTLSAQPTFTWYVPGATPYATEFQLYQYVEDEWLSLQDFSLPDSQQGYARFTLPDTISLSVGETYGWQVKLVCNPARPSRDQIVGASFEVVSPPADLANAQGTPLSLAQQYASAGFWYDAIALLAGPNLTESDTTYRKALLLDLASLEAIEEASDFSDQLSHIAEND